MAKVEDVYTIEINGITVKFPYKPYNIQKEFMSTVLEAAESVSMLIRINLSDIFPFIIENECPSGESNWNWKDFVTLVFSSRLDGIRDRGCSRFAK